MNQTHTKNKNHQLRRRTQHRLDHRLKVDNSLRDDGKLLLTPMPSLDVPAHTGTLSCN